MAAVAATVLPSPGPAEPFRLEPVAGVAIPASAPPWVQPGPELPSVAEEAPWIGSRDVSTAEPIQVDPSHGDSEAAAAELEQALVPSEEDDLQTIRQADPPIWSPPQVESEIETDEPEMVESDRGSADDDLKTQAKGPVEPVIGQPSIPLALPPDPDILAPDFSTPEPQLESETGQAQTAPEPLKPGSPENPWEIAAPRPLVARAPTPVPLPRPAKPEGAWRASWELPPREEVMSAARPRPALVADAAAVAAADDSPVAGSEDPGQIPDPELSRVEEFLSYLSLVAACVLVGVGVMLMLGAPKV